MEKINQKESNNKSKNIFKAKEEIIKNKLIKRLNKIIEKNNINYLLKKLEYLKKRSRKKYETIKNIKEKEIFIEKLLNNIVKLLNELEYIEIYNSDIVLNKKSKNYSNLNSILNFTTTKNIDEIKEGADCNIQLFYFYEIIRYIINDNYLKFKFFSDLRDNHGKLYIITPNINYLYHRQSGHILEKTNFIWENKKIQKEDDNITDFEKTKKEIGKNQEKISYRIGNQYFQIKNTIFGIRLKIKSDKKEIPYIHIKGFKRISKLINKRKFVYYLGFKTKFKNYTYEDIIKYIENKLENNSDKAFFKKVLIHLNKEKIENIFGIKKG